MSKDSEIKFRVDAEFRARFERVAQLNRRQPSDMGRLMFEDAISREELALGIALRDGEAPTTSPPPGSNNYGKTPKPRTRKP